MGGLSSIASSSVGDAVKKTIKTGGMAAPLIPTAFVGKQLTKLSDNKNQLNKQLISLKNSQEINRRNKKNILEEQLASRRARLGSMGISVGGSAVAGQQGLSRKIYEDIAQDDTRYDERYSDIYNDYQKRLRQQLLSTVDTASKVIK